MIDRISGSTIGRCVTKARRTLTIGETSGDHAVARSASSPTTRTTDSIDTQTSATESVRIETDGGTEHRGEHTQHPLFLPLVLVGGILFGFGLGFSHMAQPEVVLSFLQFTDFGLLFVMFGAAAVTFITVFGVSRLLGSAPLTGRSYGRRLKTLDTNVVIGGGIFGVGWGLSGICPGAAYASLGIGNYPILWGIVGMFIGAYIQGYWRSSRVDVGTPTSPAD